jgi:RNA polymerase sigma factor (TIGR02999 family)
VLPPIANLTQVLQAAHAGNPQAANQLLTAVYNELRRLAGSQIAREAPGLTLQPTALVHEAYLRLIGDAAMEWSNRAHFFAAAAQAMRRILIERARRANREKHGGNRQRLSLDLKDIAADEHSEDLLALDEALIRLEQIDKRKSQIVMLRFFAGMTIERTAEALELSPTTVKDEWMFARAWLHHEVLR